MSSIVKQLVLKAHGEIMRRAAMGEIITYGELAVIVGLPRAGHFMASQIGMILGDLFRFYDQRGWPKLTAIVVHKRTKMPGGGFFDMCGDDSDVIEKLGKETYAALCRAEVWRWAQYSK